MVKRYRAGELYNGSGKAISWDVNSGAPMVKCECRCVPDTGEKHE